MFENDKVINQKLNLGLSNGVELVVKREDLLHQEISGNKFRKLKYNLLEAKAQGINTVLTFGGAYSNHIAATAASCRILGLKSIGVIRGQELSGVYKQNPTLHKASLDGMHFEFVTRSDYRLKAEKFFLERLRDKFGEFYLIPEGGSNELAVQGAQEILKPCDLEFNYICCAVGTGGTLAGLINSSGSNQKVLGYPALKGDFLYEQIRRFTTKDNWDLVQDYHFGGYAKVSKELLFFIDSFQKKNDVLLDPIYTGKMLYGIMKGIENGFFKDNSKILAIHTGGLQGWNDNIKGIQ
ncbi:1-aminocyclopropane-1-carboxylate deaminase/D-cysteine desulfhydrase [Myroides sp. LJL119]